LHIWNGGQGTILEIDDYLHLIYRNELEIKDATDTQKSASYVDFHLEINNMMTSLQSFEFFNIHI
jgi:hypothetical protein